MVQIHPTMPGANPGPPDSKKARGYLMTVDNPMILQEWTIKRDDQFNDDDPRCEPEYNE